MGKRGKRHQSLQPVFETVLRITCVTRGFNMIANNGGISVINEGGVPMIVMDGNYMIELK